MFRALLRYTDDHISADGAMWILALDGILLIPAIFAVFFYPMEVAIGVGAAMVVTICVLALMRVMQKRVHT